MASIKSTDASGSDKPSSLGDWRFKHGRCGTPEYRAWQGMLRRCCNPHSKSYPDYGGRGISACERWKASFEAFFADMGERPSADHSIDRIDNSLGYSPENCRWATRAEQQRNRRDNVYLEHAGKRMMLVDWADEIGMNRMTLGNRIKAGWTAEEAITTPAKPCVYRTNPDATVPPKPGDRKYRGTTWHKPGRYWIARIVSERRPIHLGCFNTAREAALAHDEAARRLHGPKAILNFPDCR